MAFEADCGVSTVLEALRVTDTARPLAPGECHGSLGASRAMQPGRPHHGASPFGLRPHKQVIIASHGVARRAEPDGARVSPTGRMDSIPNS